MEQKQYEVLMFELRRVENYLLREYHYRVTFYDPSTPVERRLGILIGLASALDACDEAWEAAIVIQNWRESPLQDLVDLTYTQSLKSLSRWERKEAKAEIGGRATIYSKTDDAEAHLELVQSLVDEESDNYRDIKKELSDEKQRCNNIGVQEPRVAKSKQQSLLNSLDKFCGRTSCEPNNLLSHEQALDALTFYNNQQADEDSPQFVVPSQTVFEYLTGKKGRQTADWLSQKKNKKRINAIKTQHRIGKSHNKTYRDSAKFYSILDSIKVIGFS